jgi:hypothetical protein
MAMNGATLGVRPCDAFIKILPTTSIVLSMLMLFFSFLFSKKKKTKLARLFIFLLRK